MPSATGEQAGCRLDTIAMVMIWTHWLGQSVLL